MSYEVVFADKYDLGDLVEEISLEDAIEEIAYRANIRLVVTPDLPVMTPGQEIRISGIAQGDKQMTYMLNPGVVWECESTNSGTKHLSVTAYDRTIYLAKSEDELLLPAGQTATQRLKEYARTWGVQVDDRVPDTGIRLARSLRRSQSIYAMMLDDLKETASKGGAMYRPRMTPSGLTLVKLGGNAEVWALDWVEETGQVRTLEGAVTQVKVLGVQGSDKQLSPVLALIRGETDKYGTLQKVIQDCEIETVEQAKEAAKNALLGLQETFTVTAPDINVIRAGDRVMLGELELLVTRVRHQLGSPGHMQLELAKEVKVRRDWCA